MYDPQQAISDLEAEIEALAHATERCRKIIVVSKIVTGAGGLLLLLTVTGLIQGGPVALVLAITAMLGGIALFGSTTSTREQFVESIRAHEARRAKLINGMTLQNVGGN
jgi:hypothetical protein